MNAYANKFYKQINYHADDIITPLIPAIINIIIIVVDAMKMYATRKAPLRRTHNNIIMHNASNVFFSPQFFR